jgi:hypothetical protein
MYLQFLLFGIRVSKEEVIVNTEPNLIRPTIRTKIVIILKDNSLMKNP